MKHIKKFTLLVLFFVLFTAMPWNFNVDAAPNQNVEVVLLFDVSGSMVHADPETNGVRLSIEAAHQFAFNYPTDANLFITVVPYNSKIYSGFPKVNVSTERGMTAFGEQLDDIMTNSINGFRCWTEDTDIGTALEVADDLLSNSYSDKKAVILFTDGKIDLINDEITTEESEAKAIEKSQKLRNAGIPIYSIGLNCNNGVDQAQLETISGRENVHIVSTASDLIGAFSNVYTFLFDAEFNENDNDSFEVVPDVASEKTFRIYGQAVKEANVNLSSGAALHTIKVTAPDGRVVANADLRNPTASTIDESVCVINSTPSSYNASIKLISPMDGDWSISVTGEKSTVITRKIYLFDLHISDNASETAVMGEAYEYTAEIYNENNVLLTSDGLFDTSEGASAKAVVTENSTNKTKTYNGTLNASGHGYDFAIEFTKTGQYTIQTTIYHSQFEVSSDEKTVTVLEPEVEIIGSLSQSAKLSDDEKNIKVSLVIEDSETGDKLGFVPDNFSGVEFSLFVNKDGQAVDSKTVSVTEFVNGAYEFNYEPTESGVYTFEVCYELGGKEQHAVFGGIEFTVPVQEPDDNSQPPQEPEEPEEPEEPKNSEIQLDGDITDSIEESGFSGEFKEEIELDDVFVDSDGDELSYEIEIDGDDDVFSAEYDEDSNSIIVKADGFGEATLIITVTDGKGAVYEYEIDLVSESLWPIVIIIGIVVLVLLIALIIFLIILKKKKVISIGFNVKFETTADGAYNSKYAIYNVSRLSNKKNAKGTMSLAQILNTNGYASLDMSSTMSEDEIKNFIAEYCHGIVLTGVPFKREFKIEHKNIKTKKTIRKYVFKKYNVIVRINDSTEITFGSSHSQL